MGRMGPARRPAARDRSRLSYGLLERPEGSPAAPVALAEDAVARCACASWPRFGRASRRRVLPTPFFEIVTAGPPSVAILVAATLVSGVAIAAVCSGSAGAASVAGGRRFRDIYGFCLLGGGRRFRRRWRLRWSRAPFPRPALPPPRSRRARAPASSPPRNLPVPRRPAFRARRALLLLRPARLLRSRSRRPAHSPPPAGSRRTMASVGGGSFACANTRSGGAVGPDYWRPPHAPRVTAPRRPGRTTRTDVDSRIAANRKRKPGSIGAGSAWREFRERG